MFSIHFRSGTTKYFFDKPWADLQKIAPPDRCILVTDEHVFAIHGQKLEGYDVLITGAGEANKKISTIEQLAGKLLEKQITRRHTLVGVGGGVITDVTGFLASVYMRGVKFGFVPTSLMAMVDASVGGKNGVNTGSYKNMLGTVKQPSFIFYHEDFLQTLPQNEWVNGFAEVIKYALIKDELLFEMLQFSELKYYQAKPSGIIARCVQIKNEIVLHDEQDNDIRKLLNFGHTAGHAFEMANNIPHGEAVALGMIVACRLSEKTTGLDPNITQNVKQMLRQYQLPTSISFDEEKLMDILKRDKKGHDGNMDYVLLKKPGTAVVQQISFEQIMETLKAFKDESDH